MTARIQPARPWPEGRRRCLAIGGLILALVLAYLNSLHGVLVLDDVETVTGNESIRHLSTALSAPGHGTTVEGRPVLNLSLALNYAVGQTSVFGYHLANLAIHLAACLALFGIVRRLAARQADLTNLAVPLAAVAALLWGLHPLQTESVTYISQRAESLMGLFFLGSLYCLVRGAETSRRGWYAGSIVLAWLSAGTKEVAVVLPVMAVLLDRTFLAGSFREVRRRRQWVHAGIATSWIIVAALVAGSGDRGGTIGFASGATPWTFVLCQSRAIFHYLRLTAWPHPLILDYGSDFISFGQALPWALGILALLALTGYALVRAPIVGFFGAWFFIALSPSSSFVGGSRQMLAEHRMYLPLAALAVGVAVLGARRFGRGGLVGLTAVALGFGAMTVARNADFRDPISLYEQTVQARPSNPWAHYNLGKYLGDAGRYAEAIAEYREAIALNPQDFDSYNNVANRLSERPETEAEAITDYEKAIAINPGFAEARYNLANVLARTPGRLNEAIAQYRASLEIYPRHAEAHYNFANTLRQVPGAAAAVISEYREATRLKPDYFEAHNNLAIQLAQNPQTIADALPQYAEALRIQPDSAEAHCNLAVAYFRLGRRDDAIRELEAALRLKPDYPDAAQKLAFLRSSP